MTSLILRQLTGIMMELLFGFGCWSIILKGSSEIGGQIEVYLCQASENTDFKSEYYYSFANEIELLQP